MNNEPFHVMAQDWRYQSSNKALITTLHVGQLPSDVAGETVLIDPVAPPAKPDGGGRWSVPPIILPPTGGGGGTIIQVRNVKCTCFGGTSWDKQITAQRNMDISMSPWDDNLMTVTMIPHEQGRFFYGLSAQSDIHGSPYNYQGPSSNGNIVVRISRALGNGGTVIVDSANSQVLMNGIFDPTHWRSTAYITSVLTASVRGFMLVAKDQPVIAEGLNLGQQTLAHMNFWMFKISEK